MKKKTIHLFHLLEFTIISLVIMIFLLANPRTLSFLADKLTTATNLEYSDISGNVLTNIHIKNLRYKDKIIAKNADIDFTIYKLLFGKIEVDNLNLHKVDIKNIIYYINSLDKNSSSSENNISLNLDLHHAKLDFNPYAKGKYKIDKIVLNLHDISLNEMTLNAKKLIFDINTNIWQLHANGFVKNNIFHTKAKVFLNNKYFKKFIKDMNFNSLNPVDVDLTIDKDKLEGDIKSSSKKVFDKDFKFLDIKVKELTTHAKFEFKDLKLHFHSKIKASSKYAKDIKIDGDFYYKKGESFYYKGVASLNSFKNLDKNITKLLTHNHIKYQGDKKGLYAYLKSDKLTAVYDSNNSYLKPKISINSKELPLEEFIKINNEKFKNAQFKASINTTINYHDIKNSLISYKILSNIIDIDGEYSLLKNVADSKAMLSKNSLLYKINKDIKLKNIFPIDIKLKNREKLLNIDAKNSDFKVSYIQNKITNEFNSTIDATSSSVKIEGNFDNYNYDISVNSIKEFETTIQNYFDFQTTNLDGELHIVGEYKDKKYTFQTDAKWILYEYARYKYFYLENLILDANLKNNLLTLEQYGANAFILDRYRRIYSKKQSSIDFTNNDFAKLNLYVNGINILGHISKDTNLKIYAKNYYFNYPEAKVHLNLNLNYKSKNSNSSLSGNIKILNGEIYYKVKNTHTIEDKDIIFVNKNKEKNKKKTSSTSIFINIKSNQIRYKQAKNNINLILDITLQKLPYKDLKTTGVVKIIDGVYVSENKRFELGKGELLFDGEATNPYLNLKAYYKKDPYTITILVGGKMDAPSLNFSSTPYLTQNDILSILLFNTKASSLTNSDSNSNPALSIFGSTLAKGLADTVGIKLERVDLTTTKEGTIGVELEKRIGKRTTIIYQNDIIQTIKIRYKNTKNIETDFTFSPESSGIDIIYKNEK